MGGEGKIISPGATVGILGGGQLGRMIALSGWAMGYRFICLDPGAESPCGQVCADQLVASYDDLEAALELARQCDLITYEFENIPAAVTAVLEKEAHLPQGSELLGISRHRAREKEALRKAGAKTAPFRLVVDEASFQEALEELGAPAVLKTATGGYDGKGQRLIRARSEGLEAFQSLQGRGELVLEGFVDFQCELSVVAVRSVHGECRVFEAAENIHVDGILHLSIAPARVSEEIRERARALAVEIAESWDLVGTLGVEFFLGREGELLVNEVAPRPHNSGHYTLDGCWTSQFEQHLRGICGLPLGNPGMHTPVVMVNLLGEEVSAWREELSRPGPERVEIKTHFYGKKEARKGRKMGHLNLLAADPEEALAWVEQLGLWKKS